MTPCALSHLSSLPRLRELDIRIHTIEFADGLGNALSAVDCPFPGLQRLTLTSECMPLCTELIRAIRSSEIHQFEYRSINPVSEEELVAFGSALANHPSIGTLATLEITLGESAIQVADVEPLPPSAFLPFALLRHLKVFKIAGPSFAGLDDATLEAMADGWPDMEHAWMVPPMRSAANVIARATFSVFNAFSKNCPNLYRLGFALEDVTREAIGTVMEAQTRARGLSYLTSLGVGPSILTEEDIPVVAALFSLWFPQRVHVTSWNHFDEICPEDLDDQDLQRMFENNRHWDQASTESDELFWTVRAQERQWRRFQKRCIEQGADVASDPRSA